MNTAVIAVVLVFSILASSAVHVDAATSNTKVKKMSKSVLDLLTNVKLAPSQMNPTSILSHPSESEQPSESGQPSESSQPSESGQPSGSSLPSESSQSTESKQSSESRQRSGSSQPSGSNEPSENQPSNGSPSLESHDPTDASKTLHRLVKRWGRQMFGCHCTGFHIHCHLDLYCATRYGHGFKCKKSCCGFACGR